MILIREVEAMIEVTTAVLAAHPFLRGMPPGQLEALGTTASEVTFDPGQRIFEAGGYAGQFWLIQSGHIALDVRVPGEGIVIVETVGIGDLLGWSWLFPPFSWTFGAVTISPVRAFEFDAAAVRACCAADPALGGEVTRRVACVMARRLTAARTRLLAVSGRALWT
jgi:CRP/FNR family cyclic AMP-dependent transcriptional regulator